MNSVRSLTFFRYSPCLSLTVSHTSVQIRTDIDLLFTREGREERMQNNELARAPLQVTSKAAHRNVKVLISTKWGRSSGARQRCQQRPQAYRSTGTGGLVLFVSRVLDCLGVTIREPAGVEQPAIS
jgi:hypothetical protein